MKPRRGRRSKRERYGDSPPLTIQARSPGGGRVISRVCFVVPRVSFRVRTLPSRGSLCLFRLAKFDDFVSLVLEGR